MKLALAFALVGSAAAFAPQASVSLSFVALLICYVARDGCDAFEVSKNIKNWMIKYTYNPHSRIPYSPPFHVVLFFASHKIIWIIKTIEPNNNGTKSTIES